MEAHKCIQQTIQWVKAVVIKHNFCPFAAAELLRRRVRYGVGEGQNAEAHLALLAREWKHLDQQADTATTLLVFPEAYPDFADYLDFVGWAEALLRSLDYEGIYQLASFHPDYRFAGAEPEDPANYTNRSPYPMLHILREAQLERVLAAYHDPEGIPLRNIDLARSLGLELMREERRRSME
ncbi:MAG: DUF1415 domain-containing protein [Bacteroidota bacterium]